MKIERQLITPTIAREILERNVTNRPIREAHVTHLAKQMKEGDWKCDTGELIQIGKSGSLLNGQHRLNALIRANVSLFFHLATEVNDDVFDVLDTGSTRSASDVLSISGVPNALRVAAVIGFYNSLKDKNKLASQKYQRASNSNLLIQYNENPQMWQSITARATSLYLSFAKIVPISFIGGFYAFFYHINPDHAEAFLSQLCTGKDIENNAIDLLRNKLLQDKMSNRKMMANVRIALTIKAWNYFRKGFSPKLLAYDFERDSNTLPL
jgi:hypothetical protein